MRLYWVVGGLIVVLYAVSRFESPTPARATTTFARYWVARFCYVFAMLMLFAFLGGGITQMPAILALITADLPIDIGSDKLPGPLLSALLLTALLPHVPILSKLDEFVKEQFRRFGNIPFEVVQLGARLQQGSYEVPARFRLALADELDQIAQGHAETKAWESWTKIAGVYVTLLNLSADARYASYLHQKKAWFDQLATRYQMLKVSLVEDPDLLSENRDSEPRALRRMRTQFREQINGLRSDIFDLLAGGILQCERGRSARNKRLKDLGLEQPYEVRNPLGFHEIVTIGCLVFLAMNAAALAVSVRIGELQHGVMIGAMVSIIYGVALIAAIYPKGLWGFFDIGALSGRRPVGGYFVSALLAAILALFISLTFKYLFEFSGDFVKALEDMRYRWPWLAMTAGFTFAIAWAADDYYSKGKDAPKWLRFAEAVGMAIVFLGLQWWTQQLLEDVAKDRATEHERALVRLILSGIFGFCIGFVVPHKYRNASSRVRPVIVGPAAGGDASVDVERTAGAQRDRFVVSPP